MKHERSIKKVGYFTLAVLLTIVALSYSGFQKIERGEAAAFFSERVASVGTSICAWTFYAAVAVAGFIVVQAFHLGFTQADSRQKHEHDA